MRNVKRIKKAKSNILMDGYESSTKHIATRDARLSMGYGDDSNNDDNIELSNVEGMDDIDYLFEDVTNRKSWEYSEV
jgi:hypothetical protein